MGVLQGESFCNTPVKDCAMVSQAPKGRCLKRALSTAFSTAKVNLQALSRPRRPLLPDAGPEEKAAAMKTSYKLFDLACSGLPGLLLTMGNADRTEPLTLIGPKGLERVVNALRVIAPELPFPIKCIEINGSEQTFEMNGYRLKAFRVNHNVLCYGYTLEVDRAGKFDVDRANAAGIPQRFWGILQKGETVEDDGNVYTPDMVLGPPRKGLKVTYSTDTRPTDSIRENAAGSDLFICEGMYGEKDKQKKAKEYKHMTFYEAAQIAKDADVAEMWLTHYSPSLTKPEEYMDEVRAIFPRTVAAKDGRTMELVFTD